jgi:hypothetical protein
LFFFFGAEESLLVLAFFDFGAEGGGVDEDDVALVGGVDEEDGDVCAGGCKDVAGHGDDSGEHLVLHEVLADFFVDPGLGGDEAGGGEGVDDVLEEEEVDLHLVLGLGLDLGLDLGNAGEEAVFVFLGVELVALVGEVELEGGIGDDDVEFLWSLVVDGVEGVGLKDGVALDDVGDGVDEIIEDEVEAEESG